MKEKVSKLIDEIRKPKLYHLYYVSIILCIVLIIINFKKGFYNNFYTTSTIMLIMLLWIIPTIYDTYRLFSKASVKLMLIVGTITISFLYTMAQIPAKEHIRNIVDYFPDSYTAAINFFAVFYTIPLLILMIIVILCVILIAIYSITMIIDAIIEIILIHITYKTRDIVKRFYNRIAQYFGFYHSFHALMYGIGIIITLSFFGIFVESVSIIFFKYQQHIIHYTSYYKNNGICKNIDNNFYIHNVGDNKVSISPFVGS